MSLEQIKATADLQKRLTQIFPPAEYSRVIHPVGGSWTEIDSTFLLKITERVESFSEAMQAAVQNASPSERWIAIPHEQWRRLLETSGING
jgi:hypothetical protein